MYQMIFSSPKTETLNALQSARVENYNHVKTSPFRAFGQTISMTMILCDDTPHNKKILETWDETQTGVKLVKVETL